MKARPVRITDSKDGGICVSVPLARTGANEAVLDLQDYNELISLGLYPNWSLLGRNVSARGPLGLRLLVARILTDARPGEVVWYRDGNPLNLRRQNLGIKEGFSIKHDRQLLLDAVEREGSERLLRPDQATLPSGTFSLTA